jgi:hypothetical protein
MNSGRLLPDAEERKASPIVSVQDNVPFAINLAHPADMPGKMPFLDEVCENLLVEKSGGA